MKRWLRSSGFLLLGLAGLFGFISLAQGEHGETWSSAMLVTLALAFLTQAHGVVAYTIIPFFKRSQLPPRPRQLSQALLRAPRMWEKLYRVFWIWGLGCLALCLLSAELGILFAVLAIPVLIPVLLWNMLHPGAGAERRVLAEQLACGLEAGIPISELLEQLKQDALELHATRVGALPVVLDWLAFDMRCGAQFSMAVSSQDYFPPGWGPLLAAGERSGRLSECLRMLARLESNRPRRGYLLRPLLGLPIIILLAWITSQVALDPVLLEIPAFPSTVPYNLLLALALALGIVSLAAPWLRSRGRWLSLRDRLQGLPWIWPLARLEEQVMPITAMLAGCRLGCETPELIELGRTACTHSRFKSCLNPERAAAGDRLAQVLQPAFSREVVSLVAYGETHSQLEASLEAAQNYLEGRLAEERQRLERRYLQVFQILTGLLVLLCAFSYYVPLETYYLSILQEGE